MKRHLLYSNFHISIPPKNNTAIITTQTLSPLSLFFGSIQLHAKLDFSAELRQPDLSSSLYGSLPVGYSHISRVPADGSIYEESNVRRLALSMAKRRVKKNTKMTAASPASDVCGNEPKESQVGEKEDAFKDQEVERQITAIRTIRDVEIERLLTGLRLLRSYFSKDQLQTPVQQFFKDNLPNLAVVRNVKDRKYEVQWKEKDGNLSMNQADGGNIHSSLLHQMSMAYPNCSATMPSLGGCGFSSKAVKSSLLGGDNLKIRDFILEEPSETQMHGLHDFLQTPGVCSQRLSIGMTPKTLRVPKHGEMLLSVHGSPLGVYKEDNMDAIHEEG